MRAGDVRGLGKLAGIAAAGGARRVSEMHAAIAQRAFAGVRRGVGPAATPVRVVHDGVATAVYAGVRSALEAGGRTAGAVAAGWLSGRPAGEPLGDARLGQHLLAVLNGAHGDLFDRELAELALPMSLRHGGHDVAPDPAALAAAYPDATPRLAVFLHGLMETEIAWRYQAERRHGDPEVSYGTLLQRDLGYTPVWVRYNTGLRISENGRQLAALLGGLVDAWPVPVRDMVLVGHSMGGLVARSALAQAGDGTPAGDRQWPGLVRDTVTLGSPHLGAPLEKGANVLTHLLGLLGETRPLSTVLAARSVGIKDLRYGNLVEADWAGHDPDALLRDTRTTVPLHRGARHFVVLATVAGAPDSLAGNLAGNLVGDLFVRPRSARGDTGDERRLPLPDEHVLRLPGLHHFHLLNHPAVYARLHRWLASRPDGERSAFPAEP